MHGFFPGLMFFGPALLFLGLIKVLFVVLVIMLIVRLVSHGHHRPGYHARWHDGYSHGYGHSDAQLDPRRVAAWRYAAGKIDRAEFDRIMSGLDCAAPAPPAPPAAPVA